MEELRSLWRTRAFADLSSALAFARSGLVFVAKNAQRCNELVCLTPDDGEPRWRVESERVGDGVLLAADPAGAIYLAQGGNVEARSDSDGKQLWSSTIASASGGSESLYALTPPAIAGAWIVLASSTSRLVALAQKDGSVAWRAGEAGDLAAQWIGAREQTLLSLGYEDVAAHELATGRPLWSHSFSRRVAAMPSLVASLAHAVPSSGLVHVLDGDELLAIDLRDGAIRWRAATRGPASFTGNGKTLLVVDGETWRGLDAQSGEARWSAPSGGRALVAPLTQELALAQRERATTTVDYATGKIDVQQMNTLGLHDELLAARDGRAVVTLGNDARLFLFRDGRLFQGEVGQHPGIERLLDRTRADAHTLQALLHERWIAVYSKDHTIEMFRWS